MTTETNNEHRRKDDMRPAGELEWKEAEPRTAGMPDVMIDVESAGTMPGSAILSIGAVSFGPAGLGKEFYAPISLSSCAAAGLLIDPTTIAWWMKQTDAARTAAFRDDAESLPAVLLQFTAWFAEHGAERPWCQGANFDAPLLEAAYRACGMTPPWRYWNVRDTRTLYELADVKVDRVRGTHHNALDDARAQAEAAVVALQRLPGIRAEKSPLPAPAAIAAVPFDAKDAGRLPQLKHEVRMMYQALDDGEWAEHVAVTPEGQCLETAITKLVGKTNAPTAAARDVLAERGRQIEAEGWTTTCDDEHAQGQMARAAACYAAINSKAVPLMWPWAPEWWKPSDDRRNLVKAGALILAEIERIDRAAMSASPGKSWEAE